MSVPLEHRRYLYEYTSDFGATYGVVLSVGRAAIGGFPEGDPGGNSFPKRAHMRHVNGATVDGTQKISVPMATLGNAAAVLSDGNFIIDSVSYIVTGYVGEKFSLARTAP